MSRIAVLDQKTANAIKAGEVIERPVSVVKELLDNSIDSGADRIIVEYENGGISRISVTDNGIGMDREDAVTCFKIHATSKIKNIDDLFNLTTMGFRGEAIPSIAACSRVTIITKQADSKLGTKVVYEDGIEQSVEECSSDNGTVVTVEDLFYNTPARYKFLKKDTTEGMYICSLVEKIAIVNPHVSIKLMKDGQTILSTPGNGSMLDTIYSIHGKAIANQLIPVEYSYEGINVRGFVGKPDLTRGNRGLQQFYVNSRPVKSATASAAIDEAYRNKVMKGKFPICFLNIYVNPSEIDCNIHPQKIEVKFTNDSDLFRAIYHAVNNGLESLTKKEEIPVRDELLDLIEETSSNEYSKTTNTNISFSSSQNSSAKSQFRDLESVSKPSQIEIRATNNILNILSGIDTATSEKEIVSEEKVQEVPATNSVTLVEPVIASKEEFVATKNSEVQTLLNSKIIGSLFATYIVLQSDDAAYLLDQHAAHERVLYEELLKKYSNKSSDSYTEQLLIPEIISLSSGDYSLVLDKKEDFSRFGFEVEPIGDRDIAIRAVPMIKTVKKNYSSMFMDLLNELNKDYPVCDDSWYLKIATAACKAAIKGHDIITVEEIKALLESMLTLNDPYHCPHGRPTFIKLSITDIEKMFKRIV